jgi:hypothetical protein
MSSKDVVVYRDDAYTPERSARLALLFALVACLSLLVPLLFPAEVPLPGALVGFACFSGLILWLITCFVSVMNGIETFQRVNATPLKPRVFWMAVSGLLLDGLSILAICQMTLLVFGYSED